MGEVQGEEQMGEIQGEARKGLQNGLFLDDLNEVATMGIYRERMDLFKHKFLVEWVGNSRHKWELLVVVGFESST